VAACRVTLLKELKLAFCVHLMVNVCPLDPAW
jgi:hypothetical protein